MKKKAKGKQKRLIIVHGWEGYPEEGWFPWLTAEMEKRGWQVLVPAMPSPSLPKVYEWVSHLQRIVGKVDENSFFIGHSLGCITILRFLQELSEKSEIGGVVLVAGFDNPLKYKELKNFFTEPINWEIIKKRAKKFVVIHSQDDPAVTLENNTSFQNHLDAKGVVVDGYRHFSGEDGVFSLPPALEELLAISSG